MKVELSPVLRGTVFTPTLRETMETVEQATKNALQRILFDLTDKEKQFLCSMYEKDQKWQYLDFDHIKDLPAIKWKLMNIKKMNPLKREEALMALKMALRFKYLGVVRHICNLASSSWRLPNGMTWLEHRPVITLLELNDQRPPRPISWKEQEKIIVCNSVAQQVIDNQRGRHDEFVFTFYRVTKEETKPTYKPIRSLHNTAWQRVRREVGLDDLHVHDLRHTVGMRLRMAGVAERTQDEILWHSNSGMSSHYAAAQIREIYDALELISKKGDYEESMDLLTLLRQAKLKSRVEQT